MYPVVFTCQVPVLVVDVAEVDELLGVALNDTTVVPPSPDASKTIVFPETFAEMVNVAPPCVGSTVTVRQEVLVQVPLAAVRTFFCCARAKLGMQSNVKIKTTRSIREISHLLLLQRENHDRNNPSRIQQDRVRTAAAQF